MEVDGIVLAGGLAFIVGALAFVGVFSWLAAKFDYPRILDGEAAEVLPRLRTGGPRMRAVWALYSVLPLLLIVGAAGSVFAFDDARALMVMAAVFAIVGAAAMCLGLMRWPSIHWKLAEAWDGAGEESRRSLGATFSGLNLYLGNYIGEFLGEVCLGVFFLLSSLALRGDARFSGWAAYVGVAFAVSFIVGAFRNVTPRVQWIADINNWLLPAWMITYGVLLIRATA